MPRRNAHYIFGLKFFALVAILFFIYCWFFDYNIIIYFKNNFLSILIKGLYMVICVLIGTRLPDIIERPINIFHRAFFHSIAFGMLLIILLILMLYVHVDSIYIICLILGYLSHVFLDKFKFLR